MWHHREGQPPTTPGAPHERRPLGMFGGKRPMDADVRG